MRFPPSSLLLLIQSSGAFSGAARRPTAAAFATALSRRTSSLAAAALPPSTTATAMARRAGPAGGARFGPRAPFSSAAAAALALTGGAAAGATATTAAACSGGEEDASQPKETATATDKASSTSAEEEEVATTKAETPFPDEALFFDTYNGVTIDASKLPAEVADCPEAFGRALGAALEAWKGEGRRGVWIKMSTKHSSLIPPSTDLGFDFRHAEPGRVTLTKWLPSGEESRLPRGPTHQIGVGALVLHPRNGKMLAVQEKAGPAAARKLWKMPTGLTDPGEDIAEAAVRELKEETGLDCVFDRIICFRQAHSSGGTFSHSDMFFVCLLRLDPKYEEGLLRGDEVRLEPQEEEIAEAAWIDMEKYANQEVWQASPLYTEMNDAMIDAARGGIEYRHISEPGEEGNDDTGGAVEPARMNGHAVPSSALSVRSGGFVARTLPVGFRPGTNTIYVSKL